MRKPHIQELIVYTGPMWSGKTDAVETQLKLARIANIRAVFFRPQKDTREERQVDPSICETVFISNALQVLDHLHDEHQWVAFDEIHFFEKDPDFVMIVMRLVRSGRRVLVAGLDLDYEEKPFMVTAKLMTLAQHVYKLRAICQQCKAIDEASRSQRISKQTGRFVVGDKEDYEPRCLQCFVPPNGMIHAEKINDQDSVPS